MRYFVDFSYQGAIFHGWQKQPNAQTVQQIMEHAFSMLLGTPIALMGAGRTDAGVHARKMVAHFNASPIPHTNNLVARLNAFLPEQIAVQNIYEVTQEAHARFDATSRTYEYWITRVKDPFLLHGAHYVYQELDLVAMNKAAEILLAHKDFECFSKAHSEVHTFLCHITHAAWEQSENQLIFTITANRFLRNMVRAIVGTLLEIGMNKKSVSDMEQVIASKSRSLAGPSVPAKGLYLTAIKYPEKIYV